MVKKDIHPHARPIALKGGGELAFLLIHGYTGSPTDFNGLPAFLEKNLQASVYAPLLPGHGTVVEDLVGLTKDDFIKSAEQELEHLLSKHKKVIVGGHSFGGQIALHLSARYPVHGVVVTAAPVKPAILLTIPWLYEVYKFLFRKKFFNKSHSKEQIQARRNASSFSYDKMPAYGLRLILDMNKDLKKILKNTTSPMLSFYVKKDGVADAESGAEIERLISSVEKRTHTLDSLEHGVFFTEDAPQIYQEVVEFFKDR